MSGSDVLRPRTPGLKGFAQNLSMQHWQTIAKFFRIVWPIPGMAGFYIVFRYDDVRYVFLDDSAFEVPYAENIRFILHEPPFVLGMPDTPEYRRQLSAMHSVMLPSDLAALEARTRTCSETELTGAAGRVDVVGYARHVAFAVVCGYLGIGFPADGNLVLWVTRLFIYQLTYDGSDKGLRADGVAMAPRLRQHIEALIAAGKADPDCTTVLGRCLLKQRAGVAGFSDEQIRTLLIGCLVAIPQVPMFIPNAVEQLLRRPTVLQEARQAAKAENGSVAGYLFEAVRFDPLAPGLLRVAKCDVAVACGTFRETRIRKGAKVLAAFASAMHDGRRVPNPEVFDPERPESDYISFGYGLHRCFGEAINRKMLPAILQALLKYPIRRATGKAGHLSKRFIFADQLNVEWF